MSLSSRGKFGDIDKAISGGVPLRGGPRPKEQDDPQQPGVPTDLTRDKRLRFKTIAPFDNQIAAHALPMPKETEAGIALPDGVVDPHRAPRYLVIACGPGCKQVKEGDILVLPGVTEGWYLGHGGSGVVILLRENQLVGGVELPPKEVENNKAAASHSDLASGKVETAEEES